MSVSPSSTSGALPEPQRIGRVRWWLWLVLLITAVLLVASIQPARTRHHLSMGQQLLQEGRTEDAVEQFRKVISISPENADAHFWMARCSRKLGDLGSVRRSLDEALRLGYRDPERLRTEWWLSQAQSGNLRQAEPHLAALIRSPGEDGHEICEAYAQGYCLNLQFDPALVLLETWRSDAPTDFRPVFRIGQIYLDNKQQATRAETAFRAVIEMVPDYAPAYRELGRSLIASQRLDEAVSSFRQCLLLTPDDQTAMLALATTLKDLRRFQEAEEECRKLISINGSLEKAQTVLADILLSDSRPDQAIEILQPLAQLWPEDMKIRYTLAMALQKANRRPEAEEHLKIYQSLEGVSQRLQELGKQLEVTPDDPALRTEFGSLRLRHESREEGVAWLQSVLLSHPDSADVHRLLADFYSKTGDTVRADFHRRRLTELETSPPTATEPR